MRTKQYVSALGALLVGGLMSTAALAQDGSAAPAPAPEASADAAEETPISESHLAAARSAVDAIGATDEFDNILLNAATQTKAEFIPNNPDLQTEISNMVDEKALELAPRRAALENEVARVYARLFTEQELSEIASFYETTAGQKLLADGPQAARDSLAAANVWTNGILRDLRRASLEGMNEIYGTAGEDAGQAGAAGASTAAPTAEGETTGGSDGAQ